MHADLRFLLLQVRDVDDPMRLQERRCFARVLRTSPGQIDVVDLLHEPPASTQLADADVVLLGGSGRYSAAGEGDWLDRALSVLRGVCAARQPTFASCWGFQAMARALGGRVIRDPSRAEVGTHRLTLTAAGRSDPVFGPLGPTFLAQLGHEDSVVELPPGAVLLASSEQGGLQAFRLEGALIYGTQFHPELSRDDLLERAFAYPQYVEQIAGLPPERFHELVRPTPESEELLRRFVELVCRARGRSFGPPAGGLSPSAASGGDAAGPALTMQPTPAGPPASPDLDADDAPCTLR